MKIKKGSNKELLSEDSIYTRGGFLFHHTVQRNLKQGEIIKLQKFGDFCNFFFFQKFLNIEIFFKFL